MAVRKEEVRVTADVSNFVTKFNAAAASADNFANRLEAADGRMSNLVQTGLALAPALVPLGAAAVPAIAGLATQLTFAGVAAGVTVLAFKGVGTALDALSAAKLDPSAANLQKLKVALDDLGPAGQDFVVALDKMRPAVQSLQSLAQQGLFPGATEGLDSLMRLLPQVQEIIFATSSTLGDLAADAGKNLAGPEFTAFFNYLTTTARPILTDLGQTVGNLFVGIANSLVGFDPLAQSFSKGLLNLSQNFADASANLGTSSGFQDFISYVQESGPKALDALASIGDAFVQLIEAAAPVGSVALPLISALADALSSLADSSVGPVLITAAAAVGTFGRALAILQTVGLRGGGEGVVGKALGTDKIRGILPAMREATTATRDLQVAQAQLSTSARTAATAQSALISATDKRKAVGGYIADQQRLSVASDKVAVAERKKAAAIREGATAFGKTAAATGGLIVATSGLADSTGLSNTASFGLMGTLAGPYGAAIGSAIGLVTDLAAANNDAASAIESTDRAFSASSVSFSSLGQSLGTLNDAQDEYRKTLDSISVAGAKAAVADVFTHQADENAAAVHKQTVAYLQLGQGAAEVYASLNNGNTSLLTASNEVRDAFVARISPALQRAGIDVQNFLKAANGSKIRTQGLSAIQGYFDEISSAAGKSAAVGNALASIGHEATAAVPPVVALKSSLDNLFGVQIGQQAATDAYARSINQLAAQLKDTNGQLQGNSKAALDNRAAYQGAASALLAKVNADAAAGASGATLARSLVNGRDALIQQGVAAGHSRGEMAKYVATLGLAPKNIETIISTPGLLTANQKVAALGVLYGKTPRQVRTIVAEAGANPTMAKVRALAKQYNLTPKQIRTILNATDNASRKAITARVNAEKFRKLYLASLEATDGASPKAAAARARAVAFAKRYLATLAANDPARGVILSAIAALNSYDGRVATSTIRTVHQNVFVQSGRPANPGAQAAGGMWANNVQTYAAGDVRNGHQAEIAQGSNIHRVWAEAETGGESYIPHANDWRRGRAIDIWERTGAILGVQFQRFADGGLQYASRASSSTSSSVVGIDYKALAEAVRGTGQTVQFNGPITEGSAEALVRGVQSRMRVASTFAGQP